VSFLKVHWFATERRLNRLFLTCRLPAPRRVLRAFLRTNPGI
jgi:hypothetical protein